jgi:hypothetical protein
MVSVITFCAYFVLVFCSLYRSGHPLSSTSMPFPHPGQHSSVARLSTDRKTVNAPPLAHRPLVR